MVIESLEMNHSAQIVVVRQIIETMMNYWYLHHLFMISAFSILALTFHHILKAIARISNMRYALADILMRLIMNFATCAGLSGLKADCLRFSNLILNLNLSWVIYYVNVVM